MKQDFGTFDQDDRAHLIIGAVTAFIVGCGLFLAVVQGATIAMVVIR